MSSLSDSFVLNRTLKAFFLFVFVTEHFNQLHLSRLHSE